MAPIAQMSRRKSRGSHPAESSLGGCMANPIQVPDYLRHLRHLRIKLPFPG